MAVIFAVVGGGAVIGIATADPYSDHSDYSNHSDYSDAAERKRRRLEAQKRELKSCADEVNQYKINRVNDYLQSEKLIAASGEQVSVSKVKVDGTQRIEREEKEAAQRENGDIQAEIDEIDAAIRAINKDLEEKKNE